MDRIWGYELAEIEKELIFRRENTGYVRWKNEENGIAYLDPSPFLKTTKFEYYVFLNERPKAGQFIEVEVDRIAEALYKDSGGSLEDFKLSM